MRGKAEVTIIDTALGEFPEVLPLNPSLRAGAIKLKATLEIGWEPRDAHGDLSRLQRRLLDLLPNFRQHECRGPAEYRHLAFTRTPPGPPSDARMPIEPNLALAHTIEHVMIEAISFVTSAPRISGATAAHRDSLRRFDLFVECPDPVVARLAIHLALFWILPLAEGNDPDQPIVRTLELTRRLYRSRPRGVDARLAAWELGGGSNHVNGMEKEKNS